MLNRIALKELSKQQLRGKWGIIGILFLVLVVAEMMIGALPIAGGLLLVIIAGSVTLTQVVLIFKIIDNEAIYLEDVLAGFRNFTSALCLYLLRAIFTFLWSLLLFIPGVIKGLAYSMAFYILAENPEMDVREALKESQRITYGHKWELFVLRLSFIGWAILATLTFGIGYFWLIPYIETTYANAYKSLKNQ